MTSGGLLCAYNAVEMKCMSKSHGTIKERDFHAQRNSVEKKRTGQLKF